MNPSYIFLPLLALLLAGVLLLIYYRMALRFALQAIDPQRMNYGAVLRQEMERNQLDPDRMDVKYDKLFLVNQHGQELTARLYLTPSQTDRYILFLHGYNYPWIGVLKYLPMLLRLGFNVLVPDLQAQGESQGSYITFGALESDDCLEWLEQIHKHAQVNGFNRARVGVMGESMGAVTALLTMEKANSQSVPLEEKPLFCVADCPFSDWDSMMRLQGKKRYGFDPSPLLPLVKRIIRQKKRCADGYGKCSQSGVSHPRSCPALSRDRRQTGPLWDEPADCRCLSHRLAVSGGGCKTHELLCPFSQRIPPPAGSYAQNGAL